MNFERPSATSEVKKCIHYEVPSRKKNQILHPVWECDPMTVSETHPRHTSWYSVILCHGYVLLFMLKILGTIKCAHAPFRFFFVFFPSTQEQMHTHMHSLSLSHTHTRIYTTQARHSCHVILLGIMPTAKHVTYKKSLRHREGEREKLCTFVSLWELLVKCKYSAYTGSRRFSCYSYLQV